MSLAASEVTAAADFFRCVPYRRTITPVACMSSQRAALEGTKSCAECIGCADGALIAELLNGAAPSTDEDEPAPPSPEKEETAVSDRTEEQRAKQREWSKRSYHKRKAARETAMGGGEPVQRKKPGPKPKRAAKPVPKPVFDVGDSQLLDVARTLNIDVCELLRREIASVLGLEQP